MDREVAEFTLPVNEGEPIELVCRAEPDELGSRGLGGVAQAVAELFAGGRVGAVSADNHIEVIELRQIGDVLAKARIDADICRPVLHELQEGLAVNGGHAVAGERLLFTFEPDLDVLPVGAVVPEAVADNRIGVVDPVQRCVGEDDAEAEGVSCLVPLKEHDVGVGNGLLEQG